MGYVDKRGRVWKRQQRTSGKGQTVAERLFAQMHVEAGSHWIWDGATRGKPATSDYYGEMMVNGRIRPTHVVAYELFVRTVPWGYDVHHTCEKTLCFNPRHLEAMSHHEHLAMHAYLGGRARWRET